MFAENKHKPHDDIDLVALLQHVRCTRVRSQRTFAHDCRNDSVSCLVYVKINLITNFNYMQMNDMHSMNKFAYWAYALITRGFVAFAAPYTIDLCIHRAEYIEQGCSSFLLLPRLCRELRTDRRQPYCIASHLRIQWFRRLFFYLCLLRWCPIHIGEPCVSVYLFSSCTVCCPMLCANVFSRAFDLFDIGIAWTIFLISIAHQKLTILLMQIPFIWMQAYCRDQMEFMLVPNDLLDKSTMRDHANVERQQKTNLVLA